MFKYTYIKKCIYWINLLNISRYSLLLLFEILYFHSYLFTDWPLQVKINTGVATPERMMPGYLDQLDLGDAVATLVERRDSSHTVFTLNCPADLKTVLLERNL